MSNGMSRLNFLRSLKPRKGVAGQMVGRGFPSGKADDPVPYVTTSEKEALMKAEARKPENIRLIEQLRSARVAENLAERKFAFEQLKTSAEQKRKRQEFFVNKLYAHMEKLPEGPSKDIARDNVRDYVGSLEPWAQSAIAPLMQKLFPPEMEKAAAFVRLHGERPGVTADPTTDKIGVGEQRLAGLRYDYRFNKHMGIDTPYPEYAPIDEEHYIIHKKGDRPRVMSKLDEQLIAYCKTLPGSPTPEALMVTGGKWRTMDPTFIDAGPDRWMITPMKDHFKEGNPTWTETQKVFRDETKEGRSMPQMAVEFSALLDVPDDKLDLGTPAGGFALTFRKRMEKGDDPDIALNETIGRATGWHYRWFPKKIDVPWNHMLTWVDYEGGGIGAVPGDTTYLQGETEDSVVTMYHDKETGIYYGSDMQQHGRSKEQAEEWAATQPGKVYGGGR